VQAPDIPLGPAVPRAPGGPTDPVCPGGPGGPGIPLRPAFPGIPKNKQKNVPVLHIQGGCSSTLQLLFLHLTPKMGESTTEIKQNQIQISPHYHY